MPINEWMFRLGKDFLQSFSEIQERLQEFFVKHYEEYFEGLPWRKNKDSSARKSPDWMRERTAVAGAFLIFYIIIYVDVVTTGVFEAIQPYTIFYFVFILSSFLFGLFPIYLYFDNLYSRKGNDLPKWFFLLLTASFLSIVYSSLLLNTSFNLFLLSPSDNSYWLQKSGDIVLWKNVLLLIFLNFPFDFLTILITYYLIFLYTEKRCSLSVVVIVALLASTLLTVCLYACLFCIDYNCEFRAFLSALIEAVFWFWDVLLALLFQKDIHSIPILYLVPLIFSTFVPVTIYILIILALLFCKVLLKIAIRALSVIGEREESVFKEFAFLLGAIIMAVKLPPTLSVAF